MSRDRIESDVFGGIAVLPLFVAQTTTTLVGQTTTTSVPAVTHLSSISGRLVLGLTVGLVLAAGIVVVLGRALLEGRSTSSDPTQPTDASPPDRTIMRSWLAITLAGGLLLFCAVSFGLDDTSLRSTLIGGLVANAGAAVAFYFATKSADQARRDVLNAGASSVTVPSLIGKSLAEVNAAFATMPLHVNVDPATPAPGTVVTKQSPAANQTAPAGSQVTATFA